VTDSRNLGDAYGDGGINTGGGMGDGDGNDGDGDGDGDGDVKYDVAGGTGDGGGDDDAPLGCQEAAEQQTNQGCEFWAADLPQAWWGENDSPAPEVGQYAVVVANASANTPAQVDIYRGNEATLVDSASVAVNDVHVFELPALSLQSQGNSDAGLAYRIETDVPVTAYQFNTLEQTSARYSADASLLFPTHVLRKDYTAFTGASLTGTGIGSIGAYVAVVANEDQTLVDVYTNQTLQAGPGPMGIVLDRGQVYTVLAESTALVPTFDDGNLSGTRVAADKPVAVFSGNVAANEPLDAPANAVCCADHLEQQMLPLEVWGNRYLVAPPIDPNNPQAIVKAAYRVVGSTDGTSFVYNPAAPPGAPSSVDAYETAYFVTDTAFTIEGTRPFGIAQFFVGSLATAGPVDVEANGDPAMIVLPSEEQFQDSYVFLVPPTYEANYVTVLRPTGTSTTLDGAPVTEPAGAVGNLGGTGYEVVVATLTEGGHIISGDEPFAITVYGYANQASYAYPGGSGLKHISEPPPPPQG